MYFDSVAELIDMGGHGPYVWSAYGIFLLTVICLVVVPLLKQNRFFVDQIMKRKRESLPAAAVVTEETPNPSSQG